jgi:uncharacterized OsmC-like protein
MLVTVRGHEIRSDQPVGDGGDDSAPTPTELLVASLAGCVTGVRIRLTSKQTAAA